MATKRIPVVFIHGLWLHSTSWDNWVVLYRSAGYEPMAPSWPGDSKTVVESRKHPELIANRSIDEATEHIAKVIKRLPSKPIVVGHSFGGLIAQKLLGRNLAIAAVALDPVQPKGIYRIPLIQLKTGFPVLSKLSQIRGANLITQEQFRKAFGTALTKDESDMLYDKYAIPAPGLPLFQAAVANFVPHSQAKVNLLAKRGPLLITGGGKDATVPEVTTHANFKLYDKAKTVNEYKVFSTRGHSLTIDAGWKEVAEFTLAWLKAQSL